MRMIISLMPFNVFSLRDILLVRPRLSFSDLVSYICLISVRLSMSPEEHSEFWRKVQFTVDKDVVRTDRSNHFFRGENNPNVEIMRSDCIYSFFHLLLPPLSHPHHSPSSAHRTVVPTVLISYSEPWGSHK